MYLLFDNIARDFGGFDSFVPILIGSSWMGLAHVDDKTGKGLVELPGVKELSEERFEGFKKKLGREAIAYRSFTTHQQNPEKSPTADYAEALKVEAEVKEVAEDPKELLQVEEVEVENPLEEEAPAKPKPARKAKKK